MARSRLSTLQKVKAILRHVAPLPPEARTAIGHYWRSAIDQQNMLNYVRGHLLGVRNLRASVRDDYLSDLYAMLMLQAIETLERYFKEVAAVCIDFIGRYIIDDRFDTFRIQGSSFAAHFGTDTLGRALCESSTWLDTTTINSRFRAILSDSFEDGKFVLFPNGRKDPPADRERFECLEIVWQLRHTQVHNVGVITQSDAIKFHLMIREPVESPRLLVPTRDDIGHLKQFMDETAEIANQRIGTRLAELLTTIHAGYPTLFAPQDMADRVTNAFGVVLSVAGATGVLLPP